MSSDPMGYLLTTIRSDPVVAAITTRIRAGEPAPGDSQGPAGYLPFVVLSELGNVRQKGRVPVQETRVAARCYAASFQLAKALAGAVSDSIHNLSPRKNASGVLLYRAYDDVGNGTTRDPDTQQPVSEFVIQLWSATQAVP